MASHFAGHIELFLLAGSKTAEVICMFNLIGYHGMSRWCFVRMNLSQNSHEEYLFSFFVVGNVQISLKCWLFVCSIMSPWKVLHSSCDCRHHWEVSNGYFSPYFQLFLFTGYSISCFSSALLCCETEMWIARTYYYFINVGCMINLRLQGLLWTAHSELYNVTKISTFINKR